MRILLFLAPIGVGAVAIFSVSYYLVSNGSSAQQTATSPTPSSREARGSFIGRDVLAACIQADEPVDTQVFLDSVETIKARLSLHPGENIERFAGAYSVQGCPPHNLTGERVERFAMGKLVETRSEFRLFIYVIDAELFRQSFGDAPYGEAGAEYECTGDACWGVTGALFLTNLDPDLLFAAVVDGLGLIAAQMPPALEVPSPGSPRPLSSTAPSGSAASGPYNTVSKVAYFLARVPGFAFMPPSDRACYARFDQGDPPNQLDVTATVLCYDLRELSPPSPPPPFEPRSVFVSDGQLDPTSGELTFPLTACGEVFPGIQSWLHLQFNKAGDPVSGEVRLIYDESPPIDCIGETPDIGQLTPTALLDDHDEDGDGCADWEELGDHTPTNVNGLRDPFNFWDVFDPDHDGAITTVDVFAVAARFGAEGDPTIDPLSPPPPPPDYHPAFDRGDEVGPNAWNLYPADGAITTVDTMHVAAQHGVDC